MKTTFRWNKSKSQIVREATGGRRTLLFMANEARRLMTPFVPARNMVLSQNVRTFVEGDAGMIQYNSPYARFHFHGNLMVSPTTGSPWARRGESKVVTGRALNHSGGRHPKATSRWDRAFRVARGAEFTAAVQAFVKGGR
jgi:hypothetical protein